MDNSKIMEYLSSGALIEILKEHAGAARVWIAEKEDGSLIHEFVESGKGVGGHAVPFSLLHEDKVFSLKENDVKRFLQGFGLSKEDAEQVISVVGKAP